MMAAMTMAGASNSPASQRFAVRSSLFAMLAMQAAVFSGQMARATAPNFRVTILSVPGRNCPPISLATAAGLPNCERMDAPNTHPAETPPAGTQAGQPVFSTDSIDARMRALTARKMVNLPVSVGSYRRFEQRGYASGNRGNSLD